MNSSIEKISILVANYNNGVYLEECIISVLEQTSEEWKLYILDNASTDNSKEIYEKYMNHPKINILYNEENIGYIGSLKRLIAQASTDIVGILDADDKLDRTAIEKVLNKYGKYYKAGFVYTNFWYCDPEMKINRLGFCRPIPKGTTNLDRFVTSHFKTFRKSIYEKTEGYDASIFYAEDKDLVLKMEEVTRLHFVNEPLYYYRELEESESHGAKSKKSFQNYQKARKNAFKRRGLPNRDNFFEKTINLDFEYFRKRKIRKATRTIDKNDGIENLLSAKKIFKKLGVKYWLTDGTLLGYHREKDFIKHDFDLDLGSFIDEYDDRIIMEFLNEDWKLAAIYGKKEFGLELSFIRNNLNLDIFYFYEEKDKYWHAVSDFTDRGKRMVKYYFEKFEIEERSFLGHNFSVPQNCESYIIQKYGESWRVPLKKWNYVTDPPNAVQTEIYFE